MRECFSTEVVDLDNQAPNRNKRESKYFWDELNHLMAAGGFHSIKFLTNRNGILAEDPESPEQRDLQK